MSSKDQSWFEFLVESPTRSIKDETYDQDMINTTSPSNDDIDYMIIDSELNPIHSQKHHSDEKAAAKKSRKKIVPTNRKLSVFLN